MKLWQMFSATYAPLVSMPPSMAPIFLQFDFKGAMMVSIIPVIITMLFIDIFDNIGTLIGLASKAGYLDEKCLLYKTMGKAVLQVNFSNL